MNKKRLTILRDALIEHAKNPGNLKFDLSTWASLPVKYSTSDPTDAVCKARLGENFCGTSACAMGLAASLPEFNRAGLRLYQCVYSAGISYQNQTMDGFDAGSMFFDIGSNDAYEIFGPLKYLRKDRKNPLAVAEKITALLMTA